MTDSSRRRVVVVGGGMAGVTAAWELSRPGWKDRFETITLLQRDGVLGGKGASTRGPDGRILEHGLHVWLGYYDNAFRLVQECYDELDRATTDPGCPIRTWRDAFVPAPEVGVFEHAGEDVTAWVACFGTNSLIPGESGHEMDLADLLRRGLRLLIDAVRSARGAGAARARTVVDLAVAVLRGISADRLLDGDGGFERIDDEDFRDWLRRHGASDTTLAGGLVRGMYDLVFGYRDGDRDQPAFSAGLGVYLAVRMFFDFKGSIFWKMTAGMGDVVFAPLHEALLRRGVDIRYDHEVTDLRESAERDRIASMTVNRRCEDAGADDRLVRINGLPCFPSPEPGQAHAEETIELRDGEHFDEIVLAVSLGALPDLLGTIARRPEWQDLIEHVRTVPTWSAQLWFELDEAELGWEHPGATLSGLDAPLDTCASMTHLIGVEDWPRDDRPEALAYLCAALPDSSSAVDSLAAEHFAEWGPTLWPGAGPVALDERPVRAHHVVANTDPSDRYVQSLPGSGRHRLRPDRSGLANLHLAGDWTDCGINAGCIEAAVVSGLEAAASVDRRPLDDRVLGPLTWDFA